MHIDETDPDRDVIGRDEPEVISLDEAEAEEMAPEEVDTTEDYTEAAAEGLAYEPPDEPPVRPTRAERDDAHFEGRDVAPTMLLRDVRAALEGDPTTADLTLRVEVSREGVVTLSGRVPSSADAEAVVSTAVGVSGVSRVVDRLTIAGT